MGVIRLAVLGAAAYGIKKWLDENPSAKRQVLDAADTAKTQAQTAAEGLKHKVEERRQGDTGTVTTETTTTGPVGTDTSWSSATDTPTAPYGTAAPGGPTPTT